MIRSIKKGEKLRLQYISGKWKGWGKLPTESPDAEKTEQGDRCRLALCGVINGSHSRVLAIVPPRTQDRPFEWLAGTDYDRIILRINDNDNDFAGNPDANVQYRLQWIPADGTAIPLRTSPDPAH